MRELLVTDIHRSSIHDGPGIRTVVFLKGCPLDCVWCHNPESKSPSVQLGYVESCCVSCGRCIPVCPDSLCRHMDGAHLIDLAACKLCGRCVGECFSGALKFFGKTMLPDEIVKVAVLDREFYDSSGGGLTVSGGEPMAQFEGLMDLLMRAKAQDLNICLDTCGYAPTEHYEQVLQFVDCFLFDYKLTDEKQHIRYTGVSNRLILENLAVLSERGAVIHLRCPIIPGLNDNDAHLKTVAKLPLQYPGIASVEPLAYHSYGQSKSRQIGAEWKMGPQPSMTGDELRLVSGRLQVLGCPNYIL